MRSLKVCKKCKWFYVSILNGDFIRCDVDSANKKFSLIYAMEFDPGFYTEDEFKARKSHPDCVLRMEQVVMLGGEEKL